MFENVATKESLFNVFNVIIRTVWHLLRWIVYVLSLFWNLNHQHTRLMLFIKIFPSFFKLAIALQQQWLQFKPNSQAKRYWSQSSFKCVCKYKVTEYFVSAQRFNKKSQSKDIKANLIQKNFKKNSEQKYCSINIKFLKR